jgi:enoyl-CoA hydratase
VNEFVSVHTGDDSGGIATIVLSRPPTNTLTRQAYREITAVAVDVGARDDITAVILFGGHEIFSAGDELNELRTMTAAQADDAARLRAAAIDAVAAIGKPTVAAITGYALGSGLGLALAADWRIGGDNAKLGCTEILSGLIPSGGGTRRLPRAIGLSKAKDLVFSGRFVDAPEALAIGLLDEMVAPDDVYDAAATWAARFAGTPARALGAAKAAIDSGADRPPAEAAELERRLYVEVFVADQPGR